MVLMKRNKKKTIERLIILGVAVVVITLLVIFLKDIFFPFIKLEVNKDFDGAKELLRSKGWLGYTTVTLVEALQMIVIFIPAEFIQLSSGMSYPWWLAIILCDLGVIIGSSIIYLLVNLFKFDGDVLNKGSAIKKYERMNKSGSLIILMYILFIMPIVPFGAICYFASSKKIKYHKYILTCATAVLPSICTSILMGAAIKETIANSLPVWALVLVIIGAAALLFVLLAFVLHKFFFKKNNNTPDSVFYSWTIGLAYKLLRLKNRFKVIGKEKMENLQEPYFMIINHHSVIDPFALHAIDPYNRYAFVFNRFYSRIPFFGKRFLRAGMIPKRMFTSDIECAQKIMKTVKDGYPVVIFPEARLSTDGGPSYIDDSISRLLTYVKIPVVLIQIRKAYFNKPKWRKRAYRGEVEIEVMDVISQDKITNMSSDELQARIVSTLSFNEFELPNVKCHHHHLAVGMENALYLCPHCRSLYSNVSKGNVLTCSKCGKSYHVKNNYQFEEEDFKNLYEYYQKIKEIELEDIDNVNFDVDVDVVIYDKDMKKSRTDKGVFHFDSNELYFKSCLRDFSFSYETKKLEGIAYSVDEEFELYYGDELYYFYPPKGERKVCTRVALVQELLRKRYNEK